MEYGWERTLPYIKVQKNIIKKILSSIISCEEIKNITLINEGCRTTNYIIESNTDKKYILKIFYEKDINYKREMQLCLKLADKVPMPKIYKISDSEEIINYPYMIYEYLDGQTLSCYIKNKKIINEKFIRQIADVMAFIHNNKYNKIGFIDDNLNVCETLPPLYNWYSMFIGKKAEMVLGKNIIKRINKVVEENKEILDELDKSPVLVHGDLQGTNILINENGELSGILDWEFCMAGHFIADIGQFFRYNKYFNNHLIEVFEDEYNKKSNTKLYENWYKISRLRDMTNLLQLIDKEGNMPNKERDIIEIINYDLNLLESM